MAEGLTLHQHPANLSAAVSHLRPPVENGLALRHDVRFELASVDLFEQATVHPGGHRPFTVWRQQVDRVAGLESETFARRGGEAP